MIRNFRREFLIYIGLSMAFIVCDALAEEYLHAQAAIGIKTTSSDGKYTVSETARLARENGIDVLVTTDTFLNRWQYGQWPFRNIIKKHKETWSVSRFGIRHYLDELEASGRANPDIVIIGGVEAAPFYYWEGFPWSADFAIKNWHKHILVIGLKTAKDYIGLPVIGNAAGLLKPSGLKNLIHLLFSLAIIAGGIFCISVGKGARKDVYERRAGLLLTQWRHSGIILSAVGLLLFASGYPFRDLKYDAYNGERGAIPYQGLIDYVDKRGGMVFWNHPEVKNIDKIGPVSIKTGEYADLLLQTHDYTGFAVFYEGYEIAGRPGGVWDSILREYCAHARRSPVWAIGTLDYEKAGSLSEYMKNLRTVLLVKDMNRPEALKAMREGRMYVAKDANAGNFRLEAFTAGDPSGDVQAIMGQEITLKGAPRIKIKGRFSDAGAAAESVKILLIRDGESIAIFETEAPFDIIYDDKAAGKGSKHYYRAELRSKGLVLVTNPIFVTRK